MKSLLLSSLLPCLLIVALLPSPAGAEDVSPQRLKELKARIDKLSKAQDQDLKQRDSVRAKLRETETRVSRLVRQRRDLERKVEQAKQHLDKVRARQDRLAGQRRSQLDWLARTVRAAYEAGRDPRIKLLLNQQEPDKIARLVAYQRYFQKARTQRLSILDGQLADLREVAKQVHAARSNLLDRRTELAAQEKHLKSAASDRQKALASLNRSLTKRGNSISQLRDNEKHLEKLLAEVQRSASGVPAEGAGKPFGTLEGKLPWPVGGKVVSGFHSHREGALRWNGVILAADIGTPVRAIHAGRVVYANWMRGYGLLTIVDHGHGYLTLYGYNQSLLRDVGEWVATGDVLALAGRSGGNNHSALYFEIRHRGKVVNPARWCNRRVTLPPIARNND